jgi:hypothetical protein
MLNISPKTLSIKGKQSPFILIRKSFNDCVHRYTHNTENQQYPD